jgi:hypothetical protein
MSASRIYGGAGLHDSRSTEIDERVQAIQCRRAIEISRPAGHRLPCGRKLSWSAHGEGEATISIAGNRRIAAGVMPCAAETLMSYSILSAWYRAHTSLPTPSFAQRA